MYFYLGALALFQEPGVALLADCDATAAIVAALPADAAVQVRSSRTADDGVCYAVSVMVDNKPVRGYVIGNSGLSGIRDYEAHRLVVASPVAGAPVAAPQHPATTAPAVHHQPSGPPFANFIANDMKGHKVDLHKVQAKVTLVCFWAPYSQESERELLVVSRITGQLKSKGVDSVAVVLSYERTRIADVLDDFNMTMRNVPDGTALAARYGVSPGNLPHTFVLNERQEIMASGLHGEALEAAVRKLLAP